EQWIASTPVRIRVPGAGGQAARTRPSTASVAVGGVYRITLPRPRGTSAIPSTVESSSGGVVSTIATTNDLDTGCFPVAAAVRGTPGRRTPTLDPDAGEQRGADWVPVALTPPR